MTNFLTVKNCNQEPNPGTRTENEGRKAMMDQAQATKLCEENELAFFRADVCLGSPQSFTLEEKAAICDEMESTNKAIEDAIRKDFEALPPEFQGKLLDMLCASGCMTSEWWRETLNLKMPDSPAKLKSKMAKTKC